SGCRGQIGDVVAAGQHKPVQRHCIKPAGAIRQAVGNRNGGQSQRLKQNKPALIQAVAPFVVASDHVDPLRDTNTHGQATTWMRRLAASSSSTDASARRAYSASPTPMAAGRPNSAARIAMWELAPP